LERDLDLNRKGDFRPVGSCFDFSRPRDLSGDFSPRFLPGENRLKNPPFFFFSGVLFLTVSDFFPFLFEGDWFFFSLERLEAVDFMLRVGDVFLFLFSGEDFCKIEKVDG
jgi:hypothetical protein